MKQKNIFTVLAIITLLLLNSCLPGGGNYAPDSPAGFFTGIWHGWIAPISLILGLFNKDITIYESFNTGWWYDFGFYISIIAGFGSIRLLRKKEG
ncbi:hypothetical protein KDU71_16090 [Carboxylicivirga sediminis]|uniref:Uncharacterized protein n=1 Tax=Carboxylicivirga sediminis TaxID=2006564 RepID=A0A941F7J5_9BACT|nr:hypothetical protein [Carboxylicivirga sediminis]MBR8537094.1 hypothetical protein [Carboxylicivirga sediminis]